MTRTPAPPLTPDEEDCIEACMNGRDLCDYLISGELKTKETDLSPPLEVLIQDCAELCVLTGSLVFRRSPRLQEARRWCARTCLEVARELELLNASNANRFVSGMIRCAHACLRLKPSSNTP